MSRAFVKEDKPDTDPLPDLPVSTHPNYVTPRGFRALQDALAARQTELAALKARQDRLDLMPEKSAERDIRYLEARLRSAIPVTPDPHPKVAAFATRITVRDDDGAQSVYEIVGEDEADAAHGRIAPHAPLARALMGAGVGDLVDVRRPGGAVTLEVTAVGPIG